MSRNIVTLKSGSEVYHSIDWVWFHRISSIKVKRQRQRSHGTIEFWNWRNIIADKSA